MKNTKGFTLSEVMVTIGILGVLAAVIIPAVMNVAPDNNKVMFKKAYYSVEKVVSSLIADDTLYPVANTGTNTDTTLVVPAGFNDKSTTNMGVPGGNDKFCYLFSQRVNTVSANCSAGAVATVPAYTVITTDGMVWTFSVSPFSINNNSYTTEDVLLVDVNGVKTPNCFYVNTTTCAKPDQFKFRIRYDGKMSIDPADVAARDMLTNPTDNKK